MRENSPDSETYFYDVVKEKDLRINYMDGERVRYKKFPVKLRYTACYNSKMALKKYQTRTEKIADVLKEIDNIQSKRIDTYERYSQIKMLLCDNHLSRLFEVRQEDGTVFVKRKDAAIQHEFESDGWFLVISNCDNLDKEIIINKYKELKNVEHAFCELKHSLEIRPNFHWTENRIRAHVMVCFLALQMATLFEKRIDELELSWERASAKLRRIVVINWENQGRKRQTLSKVKPDQADIFTALGYPKPSFKSL